MELRSLMLLVRSMWSSLVRLQSLTTFPLSFLLERLQWYTLSLDNVCLLTEIIREVDSSSVAKEGPRSVHFVAHSAQTLLYSTKLWPFTDHFPWLSIFCLSTTLLTINLLQLPTLLVVLPYSPFRSSHGVAKQHSLWGARTHSPGNLITWSHTKRQDLLRLQTPT